MREPGFISREALADPDKEVSLLEQFDNPETIEMRGETFEVVDISPEQLKSKIPTLYVPGFSATPEALKDAILRTAEAGRRVISVDAPHGVETELEHPDVPNAEMRKMEVLLNLIETKGLGKVNVIANSEASIYVTVAATLRPEKFENIVLVSPAGLVGEDSTLQLLKRVAHTIFVEGPKFARALPKGISKAEFPSPPSIGLKSIFSNLMASAREIHAIANSDITEALEEVHKHGVGLSIVHGADDETFPMEKVRKQIKGGMIDGFYDVPGGHDTLYLYEPFGRIAEEALTALEETQIRRNIRAGLQKLREREQRAAER